MPRNPHKKPCQIPNCRSWAMREHRHCRAHLDHLLGPRHAGAPKGNFNALKSGRYADPLSPTELKSLAYQIAEEPDSLPHRLDSAIQSIHGRSVNALHTLILVTRLLNQLLPYLADIEYTAGVDDFMQRIPPEKRPGIQSKIWKHALPLNPIERPLLIRAISKRFPIDLFNKHFVDGQHFADGQPNTDGQDTTNRIDINSA